MPTPPKLTSPFRLSVIVPALNEARGIAAALERARALAPEAERIVADGGSTDGTRELAAKLAKIIEAPRGRARQMNAGAAAASGSWLLFLHADTGVPPGFDREIARAAALGYEAGAFRLRIIGRHPLLPLLAWGANLRTRWFHIAFGDQALFVKTTLFQQLDGFPELPLMEDYAWCLRLRTERIPLYLSPLAVETSGRRWDQAGFLRTWWTMRRLLWSFRRGGLRSRTTRDYPDVR